MKPPEPECRHFTPVGGWALFKDSPALTAALWHQFPASDWHYLNLTADSSAWESREDGSIVMVHYEGEALIEMLVETGAATEALRPILADFRLIPVDEVAS